ncbi:MAG: YcaO-like family protein [Candidatus Acidiferrales bacterium]
MVSFPLFPGLADDGAKTFRRGTHRLLPPAETVARVRRLMPQLGITRVANITGLDRIGIPVTVACRPNSRALSVSQGKGLDLDAARASTLMESVEFYHAERISLPLKYLSYDELRRAHRVVDAAALPLVRDTLFHPHLPLLWVEGYDLRQRETVWVPYESVSTNFTLPFPPGSGCFQATSNGLASGNHLLEAVSQAICEVVERDALSLMQLQSDAWLAKRRLDLDGVEDAPCREVLEKYERADIDVAAWDITTDAGIPAFCCTITDRQDDPFHLTYTIDGFGCHPSRSIALLRALNEAAQSRLTMISGSRDNLSREDYRRTQSPHMVERKRARFELTGRRSLREVPSFEGESFLEDVAWELDQLRAAGVHRVVVVDLTKPEFQVPVVRVVIPGLEGTHLNPSYVPGPRAWALLESEGRP